ncbi:MAG: hypothetical protein ABI193_23355, partial [Minicystis sp.]
MDDKVGNTVPAEQQIKAWIQKVAELHAEVEQFTVKLTVDERKHQLRFRPGGEPIIAQVGDLAGKYGIGLPDMPVQGMLDDLTLAQRLAPLASAVNLLAERLDDTVSQARSEAWQAATGNYSVLVRVSGANPSLASELAPARSFFARKGKGQSSNGSAPDT